MKKLFTAAVLCFGAAVSVSAADLPYALAVKEGGKWGAVDAAGTFVIPAEFDAVGVSLQPKGQGTAADRADLLEVSRAGLRGFYSREGAEVVQLVYTSRAAWSEGKLAVTLADGRVAFYAEDGAKLSARSYESAEDFRNGYAVVKRDGKYGYLSADGREISPAYEEARPFADGAAPVKDGKWGVLDAEGTLVVPPSYDDAGPHFSEGLLAVKRDNHWGFVNAAGEEIIPLTYRTVMPLFSEGLTGVETDKKLWGFVNTAGEITAEPVFQNVLTPFSEGLAGVTTKDGNAYARADGTVAFVADYTRLFPFKGGLAEFRVGEAVRRGGSGISIGWGIGWGWHHHHPWGWGIGWGPRWYDDAPALTQAEKRGYLDASGKVIAPSSLAHVYPASERGILVFNKGRFGWLSREGLFTVHTEYRALVPDEAEGFLLARNEDKRWGLLDFEGRALTDFLYDAMENLGGGFAAGKRDGKWALLSKEGRVLTAPLYDRIGKSGGGLFPAKKGNAWLYLDTEGHEALTFTPRAEDALSFVSGRAAVKQNGKWGLIDEKGNWITAPRYEDVKQL